MTRDLDSPLEIALGVMSRQGLDIWMSFMTWTRLTGHWIVSDRDLGKVSVSTPSKGCVWLHVVWIIYRCYRTRCEHASCIIRVAGRSIFP